ncbi:MAG TPA: carboxymuconolactone decarboxylase family protein [Acidobacteriota bacterium]|nr:carboxymuconolactone decarboxylase family protein [Acidobacteriota bacterium]
MSDQPLDRILVLARISILVALRREPGLKAELQNALQHGFDGAILRETILQAYLFAGYASTINALIVFNELAPTGDFLQEPDGSWEEWTRRGTELCRKIYGSQYEKLVGNMKRLHPDLADWMITEGYGKVLSRPFLSPRVRELLIVAMTAALGVPRQFHSHVRGAIHVGASQEEVGAVFAIAEPYMDTKSVSELRKLLR